MFPESHWHARMRVLDVPFHADSDTVTKCSQQCASHTLNRYKLKGHVITTAICGSTAAQCWHKLQKIILKWSVKKQGRLLSALDSFGCSGYVALQLRATMHTLANLGVPWTGAQPLESFGRQSLVQVSAIPQSKHFASWHAQMCLETHKTIKHNKTQYLNPTTHKSVYVSVWVTNLISQYSITAGFGLMNVPL